MSLLIPVWEDLPNYSSIYSARKDKNSIIKEKIKEQNKQYYFYIHYLSFTEKRNKKIHNILQCNNFTFNVHILNNNLISNII